MAIITLTTDFGEKDHFAGAIKGAIYSELSDVRIVDISHSVSPFSISEAAYIIQNAYKSFPKGTIHIIGIDAELNPENKHIAVLLDGHYFICANNGIMSMICTEINPERIVEINIHEKIVSSFPVLDVFVKVACHIARGGTLEVIGKSIEVIKPIQNLKPYVNDDQSQIIGSIIYVDNYGNVITNIKRKFFESIQKGRNYKISARNHSFNTIYNKYSEVVDFTKPANERQAEGKGLVVFNSSNFLEIAIYKSNTTTVGGASTLMGLKLMDTITVNFLKDK
ncbi:S-adenosyl-l-methionine hydroxide adenosyltransf erase family protein [Formosa agariphila KMM 3901]|uniref:S-adenosyl-l-methionine hydroxide adenosyltransf erase family protein n=1 Tax=Formosa agariphila (strain DSM 15362 / KCTC 12365 / LMG 23005 / KMM 3901 / M-2Alg 35-1) TaxID=1347342 RepID=T2KIQ0_FORAG|nr:SAM-dependent chlorinase/fluorinase [Formosa agariphila]CDF78685.1 S-adenosyl-l-methionine hydroxide adenosyltransf erase family protein [Formosa agariphila KMM 3901]